jgi:hypothetical protein
MNFRNLIAAAAIAALPLASQAATFVVPAAGTGEGAGGSQWQSELTLHTAGPRAMTVNVSFHQGTSVFGPVQVTLQPRSTVSVEDVVRTQFGLQAGTGALVIESNDADARTLAITSRTFNVSSTGEFGQDIPSVRAEDAIRAGDIAALTGPSDAGIGTRFNFGVYALENSNVQWQVLRADGTIAATKVVTYAAGQHAQYNAGIASLLDATTADNDTVHARLTSGKAVFYGSTVNVTGDPSFVPAVRTRDDIRINFAGLDVDENGTVDIPDANHDGILDQPIQLHTSLFGSHVRVVAAGEFGEAVTFEVVSTPAAAVFLDNLGTLRLSPFGDVKNTTGEIVVKARSGASESTLTIPVIFR